MKALTQEEIQRLDTLLEQLKEWRDELYELLTDVQRKRINELQSTKPHTDTK